MFKISQSPGLMVHQPAKFEDNVQLSYCFLRFFMGLQVPSGLITLPRIVMEPCLTSWLLTYRPFELTVMKV